MNRKQRKQSEKLFRNSKVIVKRVKVKVPNKKRLEQHLGYEAYKASLRYT
jgi:hypothetical protein